MAEDVVGAITVKVIFGQRNPVDSKSYPVLFGEIRIQAAIVLGSRKFRRIDRVVVREVGDRTQGAARGSAACAGPAAAGVLGIRPAEILRTQTSCQRRSDVDAQTGSRAGGAGIESSNYTVTGERKILCCDAPRRC